MVGYLLAHNIVTIGRLKPDLKFLVDAPGKFVPSSCAIILIFRWNALLELLDAYNHISICLGLDIAHTPFWNIGNWKRFFSHVRNISFSALRRCARSFYILNECFTQCYGSFSYCSTFNFYSNYIMRVVLSALLTLFMYCWLLNFEGTKFIYFETELITLSKSTQKCFNK